MSIPAVQTVRENPALMEEAKVGCRLEPLQSRTNGLQHTASLPCSSARLEGKKRTECLPERLLLYQTPHLVRKDHRDPLVFPCCQANERPQERPVEELEVNEVRCKNDRGCESFVGETGESVRITPRQRANKNSRLVNFRRRILRSPSCLCSGEILLEQRTDVVQVGRDECICRIEVRRERERKVACAGTKFKNGASSRKGTGLVRLKEGTRRVEQERGWRGSRRRRREIGAEEVSRFPCAVRSFIIRAELCKPWQKARLSGMRWPVPAKRTVLQSRIPRCPARLSAKEIAQYTPAEVGNCAV